MNAMEVKVLAKLVAADLVILLSLPTSEERRAFLDTLTDLELDGISVVARAYESGALAA